MSNAPAPGDSLAGARADAVFVRGLEFEGNHGYTAAERRGTRRFRVDVTIERDLSAASN